MDLDMIDANRQCCILNYLKSNLTRKSVVALRFKKAKKNMW